MKIARLTFAKITASLIVVAVSPLTSSAAPQLNPTVSSCSVIKEKGNKFRLTISGYYDAASKSDVAYKINGYRFELRNGGGQQLRDTGLISISPTYAFNKTYDTYETQNFASNLKDVVFRVYNGDSLKGTAIANCSKNF